MTKLGLEIGNSGWWVSEQFSFSDHLLRFIYYDNLFDLETIDNRNEENILQ